MLTPSQIATAQAIINLFETSEVLGDYGQITLIAGDTGHLTFGRSQTTLGSGNLHKLLQMYCSNPGAMFADRLSPSLPRFAEPDFSLDDDVKVKNILRATADDKIMRETQDRFFDETYWKPAEKAASRLGIVTPLGVAVVYDGHVHGSWQLIQKLTTTKLAGGPDKVGEQSWITEYVEQRWKWLSEHPRADLKKTAYRMDAFRRLIATGMWALQLPLVVRGAEISSASLGGVPPGCYDGPQPGTRNLMLAAPMLRGLDVRRMQLALSDRDIDIVADGIFGKGSVMGIKEFQKQQGKPQTGVLDAATIAELLA